MTISQKVKDYKRQIPVLTNRADLLLKEAELLDTEASYQNDNYKAVKIQQRAADKRLQANKILNTVEEMLDDLKWMDK